MVLAATGPSSAAGATMKSASQSNTPAGTGPRGPTGPSTSQPRSSPMGGTPGSVSRTSGSGGLGQGGQSSGIGSGYGGPSGPNGPNSGPSTGSVGGGYKGSTTSQIGSAASAQRASAQAQGQMGYKGGPPNAAAARASAALNAGLGRPTAGALNTSQSIGVGSSVVRSPSGAALGSFNSVNDVAVRNYLGSGLPVSRPGSYAGPKGTMYGLNDAAWAAGGGMIADPTAVAKIRDRLGYTPVGIRTNNPGNILDGPFAQSQPGYMGPVKSKNGLTYASFSRPDYGVMAKQTLLQDRYFDRLGLDTVSKIIDRYAPVDENNSAAANAGYKKSLSGYLGVGPNDTLTREQVGLLSPAMISYENAGNPYRTGIQAQQLASNNTLGTAPVRTAGPTSSSLLDSIQQAVAPKTDLFTKTNLETPQTSVPSWYQSDYTGPRRTETTVPSYRQSTYTGPVAPIAPVSNPIEGVMKDEAYSYPVKPYGSTRQKTIDAAVGVLPVIGQINTGLGALGYSAGNIFVDEENKLANMTPEQRERYRSYWSDKRANAPGRGDESRGSRTDSKALNAYREATNVTGKRSSKPKDASGSWEADAKAYGYSAEQLKDPETRALIKQLWDMGFIPKKAPAA